MTLIDYWPVALVAGTGLVAWGEGRARLHALTKAVDDKASKDVIEVQYETIIERLGRIERRLDERDATRDAA